MKTLAIATLMAMTFAGSAMAYQCSYEITAGRRGQSIDVITVGSDISTSQACKKALVACEGMVRSRYSHIPGARCSQLGGGGYDPAPYPPYPPRPGPFPPRPAPGPRYVTRVCSADLMERGYYSDYRVQVVTATATGIVNTGVKRRACEEARRDCEYIRSYNQFCVVDR